MYAKQPHRRYSLITSQEVMVRTVGTHNMDPLKLQNAVEIAEARFVNRLLGPVFYNNLVEQKNRVVTADNIANMQAIMNLETGAGPSISLNEGDVINGAGFLDSNARLLWDARLWKYVAECVYHIALPSNYVEFTSSGLMKNNPISSSLATEPATSVGASLKDLQFLMDNTIQNAVDPLRTSLHDFICGRSGSYPLYTACSNCTGDGEVNKNTSWVDIYGDDNDVNCCP